MSNIIDKIQLSGVTYDIGGQGGSGVSVVEVTQAEYDALPSSAKTDTSKMYVITDAEAGDLTNYYTKTETNTLLGGKQATLVSGTNIKTINNESLLGSGNIDIQGGGGGKAIEAGRGISVATGETADTVSFNLPISAGTGTASIIEGHDNNNASGAYSHAEGRNSTASGTQSHAEGRYTTASTFYSHSEGYFTLASGGYAPHAEGDHTLASGDRSHSEGYYTSATTNYSHAEGYYTKTNNQSEHASGQYNVSSKASTTFGDSGNTLFSVGNGTAENSRHNAFEIRQNGDIYLTSGSTDIKLQDYLGGGGGGGGTVETVITSGSTNAVQSKAIWSATTYNKDVLLTFNGHDTTNYPQGCTKIKVEDITSYSTNTIYFNDDSETLWSNITISNMGSISVNASNFQGASYEISGTTVIISYPSVTTVTKLNVSDNARYTYKAIVEGVWITDNTYMKQEVDTIASGLQTNINSKLDATAYTPTVVDSSLNVVSTNPVQNQALYSELRIDNGGASTTVKDQVVANTTALGGLSLVKLTQAQYDALATKDSNTLYVIVN